MGENETTQEHDPNADTVRLSAEKKYHVWKVECHQCGQFAIAAEVGDEIRVGERCTTCRNGYYTRVALVNKYHPISAEDPEAALRRLTDVVSMVHEANEALRYIKGQTGRLETALWYIARTLDVKEEREEGFGYIPQDDDDLEDSGTLEF